MSAILAYLKRMPPARLMGLAALCLLFILGAALPDQILLEWRWYLWLLLSCALGLLLLPQNSVTRTITTVMRLAEARAENPVPDLAAGLPDVLWRIDYANRSVTALNSPGIGNHPFPEADENRLASLFPARVSRLYLEALISVQSRNEAKTLEYRLGSPDGPQHNYEARLVPFDAHGCLAVIREISHIKDTEEALLNQQIFLQQIFDTSPCLIFLRDKHGRFLLVNRETQTTFGHEMLVHSHLDPRGEDCPLQVGDEEALERHEPVRVMDYWIDAQGVRHWFDMTKLPVVRGNETYILTTAIDISHIKSTELALMDNGNLIRAVASILPAPFLLVAGQSIQFANVAACELLGQAADELIGHPILHIVSNWSELLQSGSGVLQLSGQNATIMNGTISEVSSAGESVQLLTLG